MRILLAIALLLSSFPASTSARAATARPVLRDPAAVPQETPSPSPPPTPTPDPVLEQAKREAQIADELKKKAVSDKDRAEAEAARLKALAQPLGAPSNVQIPTGNVQTDAAGWVESQMLAQKAAREITQRLTAALCGGQLIKVGASTPLAKPAPARAEARNAPSQTQQAAPAVPNTPDVVNTLVIYSGNDLAGVELYNAVFGQMEQLHTEFVNVNGETEKLLRDTDPRATPTPTDDTNVNRVLPAVLAAPGIATGVIKSVAELLNLFRTETRFENKTVEISEDMVVSHLVETLAANSSAPAVNTVNLRCAEAIKVYYPALFPARLVEPTSGSALVNLLNTVEREKNASALLVERIDARVKELNGLAAKLDDLAKNEKAKKAKEAEQQQACQRRRSQACKKAADELEELKKVINKAVADLGDKFDVIKANAKDHDNFKEWVTRLNEQKSKLQSLINSTDLLSARLNTPDATTKLTALAQLIRAEKLFNILKDPQTFTLRVAVTANGTTKIKKNLFVDAKVRHSAGANLVYQLFNGEGALVQGAVMQCYVDYRSAQAVRQLVITKDSVVCAGEAASGGAERAKNSPEGK